VVEIVFRL